MSDAVFAEDDATWSRISVAVRYYERLMQGTPQDPSEPPPGTRVVTVQVSAAPTDDETDPYLALWPAVLKYVDVSKDPETSDRYALGNSVLVVTLNGAPLSVGRHYTGRIIAPDPATGKGVVVVDGTEHVDRLEVTAEGYNDYSPDPYTGLLVGGDEKFPAAVVRWDQVAHAFIRLREVRFKEMNGREVGVGVRTLGRFDQRVMDSRTGVEYDLYLGDVSGADGYGGSGSGGSKPRSAGGSSGGSGSRGSSGGSGSRGSSGGGSSGGGSGSGGSADPCANVWGNMCATYDGEGKLTGLFICCNGKLVPVPVCGPCGTSSGGSSGGSAATTCCPGVTIPNTLTATFSAKTGRATGLPNTLTLTYSGANDYWSSPIGVTYQYNDSSSVGPSHEIRVGCRSNGSGYFWYNLDGGATILINGDGRTAVSAACSPVNLVFNESKTDNGSGNAMSYMMTVTP